MKKVFLFVFLTFILLASGHIESIDGMSYLTVGHNLVYQNAFFVSDPIWNTGMQVTEGKNGAYFSPVGIGYSLLMVLPSFLIKVVYSVSGFTPSVIRFPLVPDYYTTFLASFINPVLGFFLLYLLTGFFNLFVRSMRKSFIYSTLLFFSSNLLTLSKHTFSHVFFILLFTASLYNGFLYLKSGKRKNIFASGVFIGLFVLSYNVTFVLPIFALILSFFLTKKICFFRKIPIVDYIYFIIPFLFSVFVYFYYNYARFGNIFITGYVNSAYDLVGKQNFFESIWGIFLSPGKSIFVYTPWLLISVYLALKTIKKFWSVFFLTLLSVYVLFYSRYVFWHGDLSFGLRYFSILIPFGALVLVINHDLLSKVKRLFLYILVVFGMLFELMGTSVPYQILYNLAGMPICEYPKVLSRENIFAYYYLNQFLPNYSPLLRISSLVKSRVLRLGSYLFFDNSKFYLVHNSSNPIYVSGNVYKHIESPFYLLSNTDDRLNSLSIKSPVLLEPGSDMTVCINSEDNCHKATKYFKDGDNYSFYWDGLLDFKRDDYMKFSISNSLSKSPIELDVYAISVNNSFLKISTYSQLNTDPFLNRNNHMKVFDYNIQDPNYFWNLRNNVVQANINDTFDFWWIKEFVYVNSPNLTRLFFVLVLFTWSFLLCRIIYENYKKLFTKLCKC